MSRHLLLNIGHNSAAVGFCPEKQEVVAYEQERLNRIKGCSAFPGDAIYRVQKEADHLEWPDDNKEAFIGHWFDNYDFYKAPSDRILKYYDQNTVARLKSQGYKLHFLQPGLSHHDAHAWSAIAFYESHFTDIQKAHPNMHIIVADGFGNKQEVLSIYRIEAWSGPSLRCIHRTFGYPQSLGLMYQYATSFCGMKENQDEYKFLGYETVLFTLAKKELEKLNVRLDIVSDLAFGFAERMFVSMLSHTSMPNGNSTFIDTEALFKTKFYFHSIFDSLLRAVDFEAVSKKISTDLGRVLKCGIVGHFVQTVLQISYAKLIKAFRINGVLLAGGVHYNVKLNNGVLSETGHGDVSIVPLAGDQGIGIGLYRALGNRFPLHGLIWGRRSLKVESHSLGDNVLVCKSRASYVETVVNLLHENKIVNTIVGDMEFGPRALCNTSTLAIATDENVSLINTLNGRDTVMPFAGVMLEENAPFFHTPDHLKRVVGSSRYMIMTFDYHLTPEHYNGFYSGIMHQYPNEQRWSGRPQIVPKTSDAPIRQILEKLDPDFKAIINTSLNVHGKPIAFSTADAIDDLTFNIQKSCDLNTVKPKVPVLVVGDF